MIAFRYIYLIVLLFCGLVFADFDYADSDSFSVNLLSIPSGNIGDFADSTSFAIDLYPVNRGWADSGTFGIMTTNALTVVVHGYQPFWENDNPPDWATAMCQAIESQDQRIQTWAFSWKKQSNNAGKGWAEAAAEQLAANVAKKMDESNFDHIHLIGHSLGTVVISEASRRLLANGYTIRHLTFLDTVDGSVYIAGIIEQTDNPNVGVWENIYRVEHYYGTGWAPFADFSPWLDPVDDVWNVGPDIPGFEYMDQYNHSQIHDFYHNTITDPCQNGWHYSLLGGGWTSDNGRPIHHDAVQQPPVIFNGDFYTENWAGYVWEEEIELNNWQFVEGYLKATLAERFDAPGNYAGRLGFDGVQPPSYIQHQDIIVPDDATVLWIQISEDVEANSAFVVRFSGQEVGRIDYSAQTSSSFHFVSFDLRPFAGQIGQLKFILDGYQSGQIWIDNLDIGRCTSIYRADFDCSNTVDFIDLAYLCNRWLTTVPLLKKSDLNGDAFVDFDDFTRFAQQWLFGVEP